MACFPVSCLCIPPYFFLCFSTCPTSEGLTVLVIAVALFSLFFVTICSNARRIAVRSLNFVDGDLVESFLDLKPEHQKKVLQIMHGMAEAKVPLTSNEDTKEEECDGNDMEVIDSWKAITELTVEGLSQAIESIGRQH